MSSQSIVSMLPLPDGLKTLLLEKYVFSEPKSADKKSDAKEHKKEVVKSSARKILGITPLKECVGIINGKIRRDFKLCSKSTYADHIKNSRDLICTGMKGLKGNALGLGFGLIEQLDEIANQFKKLTLIDYNLDSITPLCKGLPKLLRNKIEPKEFDLTKGFCELFEKLVNDLVKKVFAGECTEKQFVDEIVAQYLKVASTEFTISGLAELLIADGGIQSQDYVISSCVMSQLDTHITNYVEEAFTTCFGSDRQNLFEKYENYKPALFSMKNQLHINYLMGLHNIVKTTGIIYFADTTLLLENQKVVTTVITHIGLSAIAKIFHIIESKTWIWNYDPKGSSFMVKAYLLKSKNLNLFFEEEMVRRMALTKA